MPNRNKSLEQGIEENVEQVVREHIASLEKTAADAVRRGVRRVLGATSGAQRRKRRSAPAPKKRARRSPAELAALEEKLHAAICALLGERMTTVKSTSERLNHPMRALRAAGRIRSVGQKGRARYFPSGD